LFASSEIALNASAVLRSTEPESPNAPSISMAQLSVPASGPAVEVINGPSPGSVEIRANEAVDLAPELMVEWQGADGSFELVQHLDLGSMKLVTSCDQPVGTCVRVDERGLRPVPWTGMTCSSQCNGNCDRNYPLSGRFRFVVATCDGKQRFAGPVFELPFVRTKKAFPSTTPF
jgi:hypothetical protein